jgi:hypothetical protein
MKHNENVDGNDIQPRAERRVLHLSNRRLLKRSEVIARDLAEHIVDSRLPAGTMLPREREMIEQLGVGRTTLAPRSERLDGIAHIDPSISARHDG